MKRPMRIALTISSVVLAVLIGLPAGVPVFGRLAPTSAAAAETKSVTKYTCSMHPFIIEDKPGDCPICGMPLVPIKVNAAGQKVSSQPAAANTQRKIKYWVAPMDPTYIRDKPGKSPMGMDLVPVYEDQAASGSVITIDPTTIQNMGVKTTPVRYETLTRTLRTVGIVTYKEPQQYTINSKVDGWIERLYVNETGQYVKKGQPLMAIYSPDLVTAQQEYLLALHNEKTLKSSPFPSIAQGGQSLLEASRMRLKYWDISDRQIAELRRTGKVRKDLTLYAPYDGIVTQKMVDQGMYIKAGKGLLQLSDISSVWVEADVYEYELPWLKLHQRAEVEFPYTPQQTLSGEISYIYPYVDPKTRTTKVRLDFPNPGDQLKPNMYVNVDIAARSVKNAMVIPQNAILDSGTKQTVFVALGGGKFEPRQVKVGLQGDDGETQILQGLLDGEKVVTSAEFMLDSESQLKEAIQQMLHPKEEAPAADKAAPAGNDKKKDQNLNDLF